jgi:hypothetical protein
VKRVLLIAALVAVSISALLATTAVAHLLTINAARTKAFYYAHRACNVDRYCDRYGVKTCRRQQAHVVICDIFNDRDTPAQGRYRCLRLVRIAYTSPYSHKPTITGFGNWRC